MRYGSKQTKGTPAGGQTVPINAYRDYYTEIQNQSQAGCNILIKR
jgi:hypothetical protein